MNTVALWIGWAILIFFAMWIIALLWWGIIYHTSKAMKETWWIVAWICWKKRNGPQAKRALKRAIEIEQNWKEPFV